MDISGVLSHTNSSYSPGASLQREAPAFTLDKETAPRERSTVRESKPTAEAADSATSRNPYPSERVDDRVWETFEKAAEGFDEPVIRQTQSKLFEDEAFYESGQDALSMLEWSKRAEAIKNNISVPQSRATDLPEDQKRMIAQQMETMVNAQVSLLERFGYFAENGGVVSLDLVA